jgi:glutaminyl-peptide cyclotransferase
MRARLASLLPLLLVACGSSPEAEAPAAGGVQELSVAVDRIYPHSRSAFTQGLLWHQGWLYEGTGIEGASELRRVELESGSVAQAQALPEDVFGEGLALVGERLVQLTWQSERAFVWQRESFSLEREHRYQGEGWGLCFDGQRLVMSDGSHVLTFRDPDTFEAIGSVEVRDRGESVPRLNELECVDGEVYANVWLTDEIVRIDPASGVVTARIDAAGLLELDGVGAATGADVLNGIAYWPERERFLITGKYWPSLFEVRFVPADEAR